MTGATGFVGRYLVHELVDRGDDVVAVARPSGDSTMLPGKARVLRADLRRDAAGLTEALPSVDAIVHLLAGTRGSGRAMFDASVLGTERLLEALVETGWQGRLVHVSTIAAYDVDAVGRRPVVDENVPIESEPGRRDHYAWTKVLQERLIWRFARARLAEIVVVRPGFIYGPERPLNSALVRRLGARAVLLPAPLAPVPLNYVENTASLLRACAEHPLAAGRAFNAVDPEHVSAYHYVDRWRRTQQPRPVLIPVPQAALGMAMGAYRALGRRTAGRVSPPGFLTSKPNPRFSAGDATAILGWTPPVSTAEALRRTFERRCD